MTRHKLSPIDPPAQLQLDFLMPGKEVLRPDEAAAIIGCSKRQVHNFIEDGTLTAIDKSRKSPLDPSSQRRHYVVLTASVRNLMEKRRTV